jgi:hypothetical protein
MTQQDTENSRALLFPLIFALVGVGLLISPLFVANPPEPDSELVIWLEDEVSADQLDAVAGVLSEVDKVGEMRYVSQEAAIAEFQELFESDPEAMAGLDPELLPASFRVRVPPTSEPESLQIDLLLVPGVRDVTIQRPAMSQAQLSNLLEDQALEQFELRIEVVDLEFWFRAAGSLILAAALGATLAILLMRERADDRRAETSVATLEEGE